MRTSRRGAVRVTRPTRSGAHPSRRNGSARLGSASRLLLSACCVSICLPGSTVASARPALAIGGSGHGYTRWQLDGRRLTIVLPGPPTYYGFRGTVRFLARCGDDAAYTGASDPETAADNPAWAAVATRRGRIAGQARTLRIALSGDVAARVNLCTLAVAPDSADERDFAAAMIVRSGRQRGCLPGPHEQVVLSQGAIGVTHASGANPNATSTVEAYRACLAPDGSPQPVDQGGDEGGADGGAIGIGMFTTAGTWLAWADSFASHEASGLNSPTVKLTDLAARHLRVRTIDAAPVPGSQRGDVVAVAAGATGTVAWEVDPSGSPPSPSAPVELKAKRLRGPTVTLDRAPSAAIRDLTVEPDGKTVAWTHAGTPRTERFP